MIKKKNFFRLFVLPAASAVFLFCCFGLASAQEIELEFGTLPVIQSLPLFVADEMGLFKSEGLKVKLISFKTAMEKDAAMITGRTAGYFGDLFTPIILRAAGHDVRIVAKNFTTGQGRRMFAILASPQSTFDGPAELAGEPVAVSTGTIIEYVTVSLLQQSGMPAESIELLESKNIPLRFQMLISGQVQAATLPEPLATLALKKGARVMADDGGSELSSTVLVFSRETLSQRPLEVNLFLKALDHAAELINSDPETVRPIMNRYCNVPEPLQAAYPIPNFPALTVPSREEVQAAVDWLADRGLLQSKPNYSDLVSGGFLP